MSNISELPGLQELWSETKGDAAVCIAMLDGPVDLSHACFDGANITEVETIAKSPAGLDSASQHGTHVSSVIFAQHDSEILGIAPQCRGLIVPIYTSSNGGSRVCSQLDLARAINQALAHGADIINISGGELTSSGSAEPVLEKAIQQCIDSGVMVVAAAGNNGCRCLHVPASISTVLTVGAMDENGEPLQFSNWGDNYQENGILALGENVLGAESGGGTVIRSGTSFSAPIVSGIAALLLSLQHKNGVDATAQKIRSTLLDTAESCNRETEADCQRVLRGRLNIKSAHSSIKIQIANNLSQQKIPPQFYPSSFNSKVDVNHALNTSYIRTTSDLINQRRNIMSENSLANTTVSETGVTESNATINQEVISEVAIPEPISITPSAIQASEVEASDCGCNQAKAEPEKAYALGQIGFDFGTEAKRDAFQQISGINIHDPIAVLDYFEVDPASAANVIWTLSLDATVVYAIQPYGPFASNTFDRLKNLLKSQLLDNMERVSVPGLISGSETLLNGQIVPLIFPDLRGMYGWSTNELIELIAGVCPTDKKKAELHANKIEGIQNFLERIYYEVRNLGTTAQERAMNYAATNAFQVSEAYTKAIQADMKLDRIEVERSPICRPGSDCWDVKLGFFNPAKRLEQARHVYRFTVDVSGVIPVTVGKVRHWDVY